MATPISLIEMQGMLSNVAISCEGHDRALGRLEGIALKYGWLTRVDSDKLIEWLYSNSDDFEKYRIGDKICQK
jgi:hypothetical protein